MALGTPTILRAVAQITSPHTTASFTPTSGALVIVVVTATGGASDTGTESAAAMFGAHDAIPSWTMIQQSAAGGSAKAATYIGYGIASSATADTLTITKAGAPVSLEAVIWEITGIDTTTPISDVIGGFFTVSNPSLTVGSAPGTDDMKVGAIASRNDSDGFTAGSGYTLLVNHFHANPSASMGVEYEGNATDTTVDFTGANTVHSAMLAFIIQAAAGGGAAPKHKIHTGAGFTDSIRKTYNGSVWTETVTDLI